MAKRLSDIVAGHVERAITELDTGGVDKDTLEWEVATGIDQRTLMVGYAIGLGLPIPLTGDTAMAFAPLADPHSAEEVTRLVQALYDAVAGQVFDLQAKRLPARSASGLIVP